MLYTAQPSVALHAMEATFSEVTSKSLIAKPNGLEVILLNLSITSDNVDHCFLDTIFIVLWLP